MPEIELIQAHTHAGQACAPGQRLTVTDRQAAWLQEMGVAKLVERPKSSRKSASSTEPNPAPDEGASRPE